MAGTYRAARFSLQGCRGYYRGSTCYHCGQGLSEILALGAIPNWVLGAMPKPVLALPSCLGKQALLLKRHWETSPALWGEMGHASAVGSSFQMELKFYSLFIGKMMNWLNAAQEVHEERRDHETPQRLELEGSRLQRSRQKRLR